MHLWHFSFSGRAHQQPRQGHVALTIGNFDGVHLGHRALIVCLREKAMALGLRTAVLTFDPHPREYLLPQSAPARISSLRDKLALLRDAGVDEVYVAKFDSNLANLEADKFVKYILAERIRPRHILIGDDFFFGRQRQGNMRLLVQHGAQAGWDVNAMDTLTFGSERISSTRIRHALRTGDLELAEQLLGRPYEVHARVRPQTETASGGSGTVDLELEQPSIALDGCHDVELVDRLGRHVIGHARVSPRQINAVASRPMISVRLRERLSWTPGHRLRIVFRQRKHTALPVLAVRNLMNL